MKRFATHLHTKEHSLLHDFATLRFHRRIPVIIPHSTQLDRFGFVQNIEKGKSICSILLAF